MTAPSLAQVRSAAELREFVMLPFRLYRGDPLWVPPLIAERLRFLDPRHNPFFTQAEIALWLAWRDGRVVGRIASHVDHLHDAVHHERAGMFGFFECEDDVGAARALFAQAAAWCRQRGASFLRGPLSFSMNHECGLLVDGWDGPPAFMMAYNPRSYAALLEACGLAKVADLLSYTLRRADVGGDPAGLPALLRRRGRPDRAGPVRIRPGDIRSFSAEVRRGLETFRAAWRDNWGFVPPSDREAAAIARGLRHVAEPRLCHFAECDGEPVGLAIVVADANQVLARLGGRLLPLGWLKALHYARRIDGARLLLFGVREEYRGTRVVAALLLETLEAVLASRFRTLELSWILEGNLPVRRLIEGLGAPYGIRVHRRYRLYQAPLEP